MRMCSLFMTAAMYSFIGMQVGAQTSENPSEETVLTVSVSEGDTSVEFSRAELAALPGTEFTTSTIWTAGVQTFTGVLLLDLLQAVGAPSTDLHVIAINGYDVEIPASDIVEDGPIVAYAVDGEPMSIREKGPLWIVYPYDSKSEYRSETIYSRSIWQLYRIELNG